MKLAAPLFVLATLALLTGPASAEKPEKKAKPPKLEAEVASWDEIQKFVAEHEGDVVVVDVWSTWCTPCLRELPHLVTLQKQHPKGVTCVSVSIDYNGAKNTSPESLREPVLKVLKKFDAKPVKNFVCSTPDEEVYTKLDLGAIPAVLVYGRDGKPLKRFDNDAGAYGDEGFTYEDHITPFVESQLAK